MIREFLAFEGVEKQNSIDIKCHFESQISHYAGKEFI
jgi:hypothetical protein